MKLIILGAGQYGTLAREIAVSLNQFEKIDFLDDKNSLAIGGLNDYEKISKEYEAAFVAIGNAEIRLDLIERLKTVGFKLPNLISRGCYISPSVVLRDGIIVEPMAVIHTNAIINSGCIISAGAVINHNCILEECCHIDCNATVTSSALVPAKTKVLSNTVFNKF